jgi:ABC-2 type transport system permease protein
MFFTMLRLELAKLRGTLAPLMCLLAPMVVAVVALLIALRRAHPSAQGLLLNAFGLWSYFVLPMTVAALSALLAQIEHAPRAWDHLFALPIPRGRLMAAKAVVLMILIGVETALLVLLVFVTSSGAEAIEPGQFPWISAAALAARAWLASGLMVVIQLWLAIAARSFVAPIGLGLAGTFAVVAAMGAPFSALLPWGMPLATMPLSGGHPLPALIAGALGGIVLLPVMAAHLARREF